MRLLHVCPLSAKRYLASRTFANAESSSDVGQPDYGNNRPEPADLKDIALCDLREYMLRTTLDGFGMEIGPVTGAASHPVRMQPGSMSIGPRFSAFGEHVGRVASGGSGKEMIRSDARSVVASVKNKESIWHGSEFHLIGDPVGSKDLASSPAKAEGSVPLLLAGYPHPARCPQHRVHRPVLVHLGPEPILNPLALFWILWQNLARHLEPPVMATRPGRTNVAGRFHASTLPTQPQKRGAPSPCA